MPKLYQGLDNRTKRGTADSFSRWPQSGSVLREKRRKPSSSCRRRTCYQPQVVHTSAPSSEAESGSSYEVPGRPLREKRIWNSGTFRRPSALNFFCFLRCRLCACMFRDICEEGDSFVEPYVAGHNVLNAHARAVSVYRAQYKREQSGMIGITLNCDWGAVRFLRSCETSDMCALFHRIIQREIMCDNGTGRKARSEEFRSGRAL